MPSERAAGACGNRKAKRQLTYNEKRSDMNAIQGTVMNSQIVLDKPEDLIDGTRVEVVPIQMRQPLFGMREEDLPTTPDGIAVLLSRMDSVGPGWL
jgi:hypothetical protein